MNMSFAGHMSGCLARFVPGLTSPGHQARVYVPDCDVVRDLKECAVVSFFALQPRKNSVESVPDGPAGELETDQNILERRVVMDIRVGYLLLV